MNYMFGPIFMSPTLSVKQSSAKVRHFMRQPPERENERMEAAAANLKRILRELEAFDDKLKVEEISTAGTWRSFQDPDFDL